MVLLASGCNSFLEVVPKDKQTEQQLFATKGGFYTASNGIYNRLASDLLYGRVLSYEMIEFLGKRYTYNYSGNAYYSGLNSLAYSTDEVTRNLGDIWYRAYNTVLNCNVLLANIGSTQVLTEQEKAVLRGEMLAVRAMLHFDMLRLFGPIYAKNPGAAAIPYNESAEIVTLPIMSADSVLNFKILRDLNEAVTLLADNDPVIENGPMTSVPEGEDVYLRYRQLRLNYYAARALRARVHLYGGDKASALADARAVIEDPAVQSYFPPVDPNRLLANQRDPDRIFSTEVLLAIYLRERNDIYKYTFDFESAGASAFLQPRDYLVSNIYAGETQDYRFQTHWRVSNGNAGHDFIKYKAIERPDPNDEKSEYLYAKLISLIRLSELYYIAAESEPSYTDGYRWLNTMRVRRGVPELPAVSEADLLAKLRIEYIREFEGEGQVFFMYKRLAQPIPAAENGSLNREVPATDANYVLPLPVSEIENR